MGDSKRFTTYFDLMDGFSAKFDAIQKKINSTAGNQKIALGVGYNDGGLKEKMGGISKVVENVKSTTQGATDAVNKHSDATKKAGSSITDLKTKYEGLTGSFDKMKGALAGITAMLSGGAAAGIAWKTAEESSNYAKQVYGMLGERKGAKKVDMSAIQAFVAKASDSGYTSSTDRLQLTNLMVQRGAKNTGLATGAADALEKKFFANQEMLQKDYGVSSAQGLGDMATNKFIRGQQAKQDLDNLFGKGFSNKSQASRIKILAKQGVDIDINAAMAEHPLEVIQNRIKSITKSIGGELRGVMSPIAGMFAGILGIIDKNPIVPKILAISAVLAGVAGAVITIVSILPMLTAGFSALGAVVAILASPVAILVALGALVLYLAYKTGVLQKAWDKFGNSAIGKDVMASLQGISDFVGGLIDQFEKWYDAGGSNQLLDYFFKLIDVIGTAWDYLDKLYAMTNTSTANPLIKALFLGIAAPTTILAGLGAGAVKAVTGKDPAELLGSLLRWTSNYIAPFLSKIHDLTKKVVSLFEWIYSLWQGALSWIKAGLGITKSEAKAKMDAEAANKGVTWQANGESGAGWYKNSVRQTTGLEKLDKLTEKYNKAPKSFFEGIPGITALTDAIFKLIDALKVKIPEAVSNSVGAVTGAGNNYVASQAKTYNDALIKTNDPYLATKSIGNWFGPGGLIWNTDTAPASHAIGATFTRGGLFRGMVHSPEELVDQATSVKGPGIISRAMNLLDATMAGGRPTTAGAGLNEFHVHMPAQDFSGMKISSNVDFEKILRDANKRAVSDAVTEIKRQIGQGRT